MKNNKIIIQWFLYYLLHLLFVIAVGLFLVNWFIKIPDYLLLFLYISLFLIYLLTEKFSSRRISIIEKLICWFLIYWFIGLVLISLIKRGIFSRSLLIPISYLIIVIVAFFSSVSHLKNGQIRYPNINRCLVIWIIIISNIVILSTFLTLLFMIIKNRE